jgi:hypothetical protein
MSLRVSSISLFQRGGDHRRVHIGRFRGFFPIFYDVVDNDDRPDLT